MTAQTPAIDEIELADGSYFNPANPDPSAITLDNVAWALARTTRFGGSYKPSIPFYSVAEHAVLVASKLRRLGAPIALCLAGLHHDDAEGLNGVGDPQRPAKPLLGTEFIERDKLIDRAVWRAVGWPDREQDMLWSTGCLHGGLVKRVDEWACRFEASHIMHSGGLNWPATFDDSALPPIPTDPEDEIHTWFPPTAHDAYLSLHFEFATAAYDWTRVAA
jgi:hypothetical protein